MIYAYTELRYLRAISWSVSDDLSDKCATTEWVAYFEKFDEVKYALGSCMAEEEVDET